LSDEAVTTPGQSLDVAGFLGGIGQDVAQLLDDAVQTCIEVNKGIGRPEFLAEFFARNYVARMLK
jgi:hypothetical protein